MTLRSPGAQSFHDPQTTSTHKTGSLTHAWLWRTHENEAGWGHSGPLIEIPIVCPFYAYVTSKYFGSTIGPSMRECHQPSSKALHFSAARKGCRQNFITFSHHLERNHFREKTKQNKTGCWQGHKRELWNLISGHLFHLVILPTEKVLRCLTEVPFAGSK